jgi:hypothetical protein
MSCSGSHLGIPINIKNTKFVKDLPMIDAQFKFNQCNSFREEHISVFSPNGPVLILSMTCGGGHLGFQSKKNNFPPSFIIIHAYNDNVIPLKMEREKKSMKNVT